MNVYLIRMADTTFYKIGFTREIHKRLADLQHANPMPLRVIAMMAGGRKLEGRLHRRFQDQRVRGEWFDLTEEMVEEIRSIMSGSMDVGSRRWSSPALGPNRTLCRCVRCDRNVQAHHSYEPLRYRGDRIIAARHRDCGDPYGTNGDRQHETAQVRSRSRNGGGEEDVRTASEDRYDREAAGASA